MFKNLIHTLGSRFVVSLFNLALLFITTKWMGAMNKGEIALLVLNLSIAAIVSGLFGGPSLVYLVPRFRLQVLLGVNYAWSIVTAVLVSGIATLGWLPSPSIGIDLFVLALMECIVAAHTMVLLGKERVKGHNFVQVIKIGLTVLLLVAIKLDGTALGYDHFISAYRYGLLAALVYSVIILLRSRQVMVSEAHSTWHILRQALKFGGLVQVGNVAQLLNYRLSYFFLELLIYPPERALFRIGIYSASLQVAEALWQFARSVSTVQYAKVANLSDQQEGLRLSLILLKLNAFVTLLGLVLLIALPASFYAAVFGKDFSEISTHVLYLAPGILALSVSNALSHFFAGIGKHRVNTQSSVFGLVLTITLAYPSIKYFGTLGAAGVASVVYVLQTTYQWVRLQRDHDVALNALWVSDDDVRIAKAIAARVRSKLGL